MFTSKVDSIFSYLIFNGIFYNFFYFSFYLFYFGELFGRLCVFTSGVFLLCALYFSTIELLDELLGTRLKDKLPR